MMSTANIHIRAHNVNNNLNDDIFIDDDIFEGYVQDLDIDAPSDQFWIPDCQCNHLQTIQRCIHSVVSTSQHPVTNSDITYSNQV